MEASESQNCCVVSGRKLSFKGKILYKRLNNNNNNNSNNIVFIQHFHKVVLHLQIHLLKNISAKKMQIRYFYQKEIHLLRNKVKNIGDVK